MQGSCLVANIDRNVVQDIRQQVSADENKDVGKEQVINARSQWVTQAEIPALLRRDDRF